MAPDPGVPPVLRHTTLPDGERIALREVGPGDEEVLRRLLEHVTGDSRWLRFFGGGTDIVRAAHAGAGADARDAPEALDGVPEAPGARDDAGDAPQADDGAPEAPEAAADAAASLPSAR